MCLLRATKKKTPEKYRSVQNIERIVGFVFQISQKHVFEDLTAPAHQRNRSIFLSETIFIAKYYIE